MSHKPLRTLRGFTIGELMVVVAILGVIAAIAIPTFLNQRKGAQDAQAISTLRTVASQARALAIPTTAFSEDLIAELSPLDAFADTFPDSLIETLENAEKAYNLVPGDEPSNDPHTVSVGFPLEVASLGEDDNVVVGTDSEHVRVVFAAFSDSGTCFFLTDNLHGTTHWGKDSSESAQENCLADRVKLAADQDLFADADWGTDAAPVWFDAIVGTSEDSATELGDIDG